MSEDKYLAAAADGDLARLKRIVQTGHLNLDYANSRGETALMLACRGGHAEVVRYLVEELHVTVDQRFSDRGDGWTALMYACYYGRLAEARYLVENGADYTLKNSEGLTVLDIPPFANATLTEVQDTIALALQTRAAPNFGQVFSGSFGMATPDADTTSVNIGLAGGVSGAGSTYGGRSSLSAPSLASHAQSGMGVGSGAGATPATPQTISRWSGSVAQAYTLSDITAARPKMIEVYQRICGDFNLTPDNSIIAALCNTAFDIPERGLGAFVLRQFGFRERLTDLKAVPALEALAHAFPNAPLHTISLTWAGLGDISVKVLAAYLETAKVLNDLNLDGNTIGQEGGLALASSLSKITQAQLSAIQEREQYQQQLAAQQGADPSLLAPSAAKALEGSYSFRALTLSSNPIGESAGMAIVQALTGSPTLQVLDLSDTQIGPHTLTRVAQMMKRPSALLELYLDRPMVSSLGEETTMHIAEAIPYCRLEKLSLARHQITDTSVAWIADGLARNNTITELNLRGNRITIRGVVEIARALKSRPTPCFVNLDFNDLESELFDELDAVLAAPVPVVDGVPGCVVQFDSGSPLSPDETDTFQHQRHWLVSRAVERVE